MIKGFNAALQDMDLFWITGCLSAFHEAVRRFERAAYVYIIEKKNTKEKIFDFLLNIENGDQVKIQFIFGRKECNVSFLLHTFDLDIVQVGFDGSKIVSVNMILFFFKYN